MGDKAAMLACAVTKLVDVKVLVASGTYSAYGELVKELDCPAYAPLNTMVSHLAEAYWMVKKGNELAIGMLAEAVKVASEIGLAIDIGLLDLYEAVNEVPPSDVVREAADEVKRELARVMRLYIRLKRTIEDDLLEALCITANTARC